MALRIQDTYVNTTAGDASYPYGSAKNETAPGNLDGTPLEKAIYDDFLGLMQSLVVAAGVVPSNSADTVLTPQYLTSIFNLRYYDKVDYAVGTKVVGSDTLTYYCIGANGPASTEQDPVTEVAPRSKWLSEDARTFDIGHPIGTYYTSNVNSSPASFMGVGTWSRVIGRFVVGLNEGDPSFDTPGESGGSKTHTHSDSFSTAADGAHGHADTFGSSPHTLTLGEIPSHSHTIPSQSNAGSADGFVEDADGTGTARAASTGSAGGNSPHSHALPGSVTDTGTHTHGVNGSVTSAEALPPFIAAYIWLRTA